MALGSYSILPAARTKHGASSDKEIGCVRVRERFASPIQLLQFRTASVNIEPQCVEHRLRQTLVDWRRVGE